jgi:alanyl-tRNA synthetase
MEMTVVGKGPEGQEIIDGAFVAHMMDTYGLGISEYSDMLRKQGMGFSMRGFMEEGLRRGWDPKQIINKLLDNKPIELSEYVVEGLMFKILKEQES